MELSYLFCWFPGQIGDCYFQPTKSNHGALAPSSFGYFVRYMNCMPSLVLPSFRNIDRFTNLDT
jgi:hypothetical protein